MHVPKIFMHLIRTQFFHLVVDAHEREQEGTYFAMYGIRCMCVYVECIFDTMYVCVRVVYVECMWSVFLIRCMCVYVCCMCVYDVFCDVCTCVYV